MFQNADGNFTGQFNTKATLKSSGEVVWSCPMIFRSSCQIDVTYFPYDTQNCSLTFGSWTYDRKGTIWTQSLAHINVFVQKSTWNWVTYRRRPSCLNSWKMGNGIFITSKVWSITRCLTSVPRRSKSVSAVAYYRVLKKTSFINTSFNVRSTPMGANVRLLVYTKRSMPPGPGGLCLLWHR